MSAVTDMHLPETFHRLKRTLLLFSAVLIVLGIAVPSTTNTLHLTLIDLEVPTAQTVVLLWLAALYYFSGFVLEAFVARRLNTEAMRMVAAGHYDAQLQQAADRLRTYNREHGDLLSKLLAEATAAEEQLRAALSRRELWLKTEAERLRRDFPVLLDEFLRIGRDMRNQPDAPEGLAQQLAARLLANGRTPGSEALGATDQARKLLAEVNEQNTRLEHQLATVHRDMTRLSRSIANERRLSFWLWEIGGAALTFLVGTVLNLRQISTAAMAAAQNLGLG